MRLPESKIKEAILHPEAMVRQEALQYFSDCYSPNPEVMPVAIKAIEAFGRADSFRHFYPLAQLKQTEATVDWAIKELNWVGTKPPAEESYFEALSRLLCSADPQLLEPRADQILQAPGFFEAYRSAFRERLSLANWDADRCWTELERISNEALASNPQFDHASRVVEALARQGEKSIDRILELLGKEVTDFVHDPMVWLEIFLVELAGEMRLEAAIPLIVKKLHGCHEILADDCGEALGKIGTDAAAAAVCEDWDNTKWEYRLYASTALEKIHSDTTVRQCLALLPTEKSTDIRTMLAHALLNQYTEEGIEPVRAIVQHRTYDSMLTDLKRKLVTTSTVLGITFPEYPVWKRDAEEQVAAQDRRFKKMAQRLHNPSPPLSAAEDRARDYPYRQMVPLQREQERVGRNDPCPCGSGKKFKKCCMREAK